VSDLLTDLLAPLVVPPSITEVTCRRLLPALALLPRSPASRRVPWVRGGLVRGRSPPAAATVWLGHRPSTPCANHRSRGFYTDLQGPAGGSKRRSFEHLLFHPPDRYAPAFLTLSDLSPLHACASSSLSWGCQIRPSVVYSQGVHSAAFARCRACATGSGLPHPTAFRPRGFSPPRRFAPPRPARDVAPDSDPGVRPVSACCEADFPVDAFLPSRALLPDGSGAPRPKPRTAGDRHRQPGVAAVPPFTSRLAPSSLCRHHAFACCRSRPRGLAPPSEP